MGSYYLFANENVLEEVLCILQSFYIEGLNVEGIASNNVLNKFIIISSQYLNDAKIFMEIRETLYPKYKFYLLKPLTTKAQVLCE